MLEVNLIKIYERSFREHRELPALSDYFKKESFSYYEMAKEIAKVHLLFEKAKIKQGDKIALLGRANPRWCIAYMATITYGAVIVPILQDFNANDIVHIVNHSESRLLFVGDNYWDVIEPPQVERIEAVFSLTDLHCIFERDGHTLTRFQRDITRHYREAYPNGFSTSDIAYPDIPNDHVCLLNYTSGTTGYSKGVMLTVNNLTANVQFAIDEKIFYRGSRVLSFLPLAHAYGCAFDFLCPLAEGTHVTLLGKIPAAKILMEAMREVKPHLICCVPLILEKVYRKQIAPMLERGAMRWGLKIPLVDKTIYSMIRKKLLDAFGGEVGEFIVGGAAISPDTEEFLMRIKFPITVGYGMTETAPLISYTYWTGFKPGSVGRYLRDYLEVHIDSPDPAGVAGEIVVRGENVMAGYYKNDAATADVLRDGWLHTGDIGTMDDDGTLYIRGRSKTMILSASGQNIYPEEIEAKLNNLYLVMESLVVEREGRLVAMVYPDYETAQTEGVGDEAIPEIMDRNLAELNGLVAPFERVSSIVIYPTEFEKTPKKSIRRYLYQL
ncbi:MAG: AMP-binding protein [Alistipes sp.]|jgi:long-chain acyl-CoA synthetase|nr:AMP-binding protein [Alistipes sp.]